MCICLCLCVSVCVRLHARVKLSVQRWMGACEAAEVCEVVCVVLVAAAAALSATLSSGDKRTGAAVTTVRLIKRAPRTITQLFWQPKTHHYTTLTQRLTHTHLDSHTAHMDACLNRSPWAYTKTNSIHTHSTYGCMHEQKQMLTNRHIYINLHSTQSYHKTYTWY